MTSDVHIALAKLRGGPVYRFADWPNPAVPNGRIGAYTVWRDDQLVYVGMAGRAIDAQMKSPGVSASGKLTGIRSRLNSHVSGRRSGDQFCIYVFDRLVLPTLSRKQIEDAARGQFSLDRLTRELIRQVLGYRFTLLADTTTARAVERRIQHEGLASQPRFSIPSGHHPRRTASNDRSYELLLASIEHKPVSGSQLGSHRDERLPAPGGRVRTTGWRSSQVAD